jgi:D-xylose transport system permease protein
MNEEAAAVGTARDVADKRSWKDISRTLDLDTRLLGMLVAIGVIWIGFHMMSDGSFITSRNLWNLSVQSTSIAVMATGMVLIIVTRNIDLSVGSLLGLLGYTMALVQTEGMISVLGFDITIGGLKGEWFTWIVALAVGLALGALVGVIQGSLIAYVGVPAFIVTLGGYLAWRGLIFRTGGQQGQTLAPLDDTFRYLGGAPERSLGDWKSWLLALLMCAGIVVTLTLSRRRRQRHELPVRPLGVDVGLAVAGCILVLIFVWPAADVSAATSTPTAATRRLPSSAASTPVAP